MNGNAGDVDPSAIAFGTDGWRATLEEFTSPRVRLVAAAIADYLDATGEADAGDHRVAVGYDAREHSERFATDVSEVLAEHGFEVLLSDRDCPTPALAWNVVDLELAGGVMITASHNPPEYNGIKFVPADGAPALPDVTDDIVSRLGEASAGGAGEAMVRTVDFVDRYLDAADRIVGGDLDGLTVAYDAMHGSGRGVTDELLERAGAEVIRLRCEQDPTFGGGAPEPEPENVGELVSLVEDGRADLGVVNDGDADRIGIVTPGRGYVDPNRLLAALYEHLLATDEGDVVRTVSTSSLVDRVAEAHGQAVHETAVGFKWVAKAMADHDALLGGEESGGFGITRHLRNKDGVVLALVVADAHAERSLDDRLDSIVSEHGDVFQDRVSVDCPDERKESALVALREGLPEQVAGVEVADVNTVDGCKILLEDGTWLLVRPSGTEPKLRVYAEARDPDRVDELLAAGRELVASAV